MPTDTGAETKADTSVDTSPNEGTEAASVLEINGLRKYYPASTGLLARLRDKERYIKAVDGVDITLQRGEVFGIIGESGSGKSTLVENVLRLEEPTAGTVQFDGRDVTTLSSHELRQFRENAQIIFQDPYETLNPQKTVFQAVAEPLRNFRDMSYEELQDRVAEILYEVGLRPPEVYIDTYPSQLSGGQLQRVNLARAVVLKPDLLIADEPVSMLDVSLQAGIIKMLNRLQTDIGFSMLYVSHNLPVVRLVADRIGVMYRGKLVETGDADGIIENPMHPYTRALVSSLPALTEERERVQLPGGETDETGLPSGCRFHPRCPEAMPHCSDRVPALVKAEGREVACFLHHDESEAGATDDE